MIGVTDEKEFQELSLDCFSDNHRNGNACTVDWVLHRTQLP